MSQEWVTDRSKWELEGWKELMFPVTVLPDLHRTGRLPGAQDRQSRNGQICHNTGNSVLSLGDLFLPGRYGCPLAAMGLEILVVTKERTQSWDWLGEVYDLVPSLSGGCQVNMLTR